MPDHVLYDETHRPQFHFTAQKNWLNDPNGLVYYQGEYHLFFQHNPTSVLWGNMTWGHAVSTDLVTWTQLEHALYPDDLGTIFSGSAVVDWHNTAGFQQGEEPPLIILYTSAGAHAPTPVPFAQCLAYSNDRGRTWSKYAGNPVLGHIKGHNRDPKIIWHDATEQWLMALYLDASDYALYGSANLQEWQHICDLQLPGVAECPDLFELPVDGDEQNARWVFWGANGGYLLGRFDGAVYVPETEVLYAEHGANGYAAQTWSDMAATDGRRLQISWMRGGKYPAMPFNQQMSFPVELTLRTTLEGIRLCRAPVREIELLQNRVHYGESTELVPGKPLRPHVDGDLFDIRIELELAAASAVGVHICGLDLRYDVAGERLSFLAKEVELKARAGKLALPLSFYAEGGAAQLQTLAVHELRSAWI